FTDFLSVAVLSLLWLVVHLLPLTNGDLFTDCDHVIHIKEGYSFLESPYFPDTYPPHSSCRYKIVAPLDYEISVNCTLHIDQGYKGCSTEFLYFGHDGDIHLRDSEQFCGRGSFLRRSLYRSVVLAYVSYGSWGRFQCQLFATPQPCDCGWSINTRVVNGKEARINEYPNVVALKDVTSMQASFCVGTIISHRCVLTAAHCIDHQPRAANLIILAGDHYIQRTEETKYSAQYSVQEIIRHPEYQANTVQNDIALLITTVDIEWSRGVGPICLPSFAAKDLSFALKYVDIVGWGTLHFAGAMSDTLQKITLMVIENEPCQKAYENISTISSSQMCTFDYTGNNRDSCQYDSGGPLILRQDRQFLLGLVSFGTDCGAEKYSVGVNTRVGFFLPWIYKYAGRSICPINMNLKRI
ncbi:venom serine protease-like, partial [Glossina fuscipes]|uniref:Venom serine protease-like n=1 Tax=Glossina fuscipes TaxID=7396 RepID=A0A9C5ZKI3_9MUSC